jgi:maltose alpha-D-glucosyltransferase/alpha-amylase
VLVRKLIDLLTINDSEEDDAGHHTIELQPYDYRWYRAAGIDRSVPR